LTNTRMLTLHNRDLKELRSHYQIVHTIGVYDVSCWSACMVVCVWHCRYQAIPVEGTCWLWEPVCHVR